MAFRHSREKGSDPSRVCRRREDLYRHALARDLSWEVIELNASDQRTASVIERVAGSAASMNTFFGGKRLIILDEADNLHGTADRGGMRAIAGIIKSTFQP